MALRHLQAVLGSKARSERPVHHWYDLSCPGHTPLSIPRLPTPCGLTFNIHGLSHPLLYRWQTLSCRHSRYLSPSRHLCFLYYYPAPHSQDTILHGLSAHPACHHPLPRSWPKTHHLHMLLSSETRLGLTMVGRRWSRRDRQRDVVA